MQVKNVANASAKHIKHCRWRTASVEGETTKYSKRAAAPQDCMWVWLRHGLEFRSLRSLEFRGLGEAIKVAVGRRQHRGFVL